MDIRLLVNLKIYREKFLMENYFGTHNIFALVKSGKFMFETNGKRRIVQPLEGAVFRHNVLYHREIIEPVTMYLFRYISDTPIFADDHVLFTDCKRIKSTISLLEELDKGVFKEEFEHRKNLLLDIVTQYSVENNLFLNESKRSDNPIEQAISFISANMHKKISLAEVGEKTGLSYVQFLRRFQSYTGMSPSDYITALRIQKAKSMLIDTEMFIKDIANLCGFENEYYFSNFFKKHTGVSPLSFRKMRI